ncbi:hypothetical protein FPE01S_02_09930 [Flavihumibacter petaseus NBRC 106054]|uniref:Glycosyltransferase n=1 Tax=Flavihumibacter petaseus NBRC 106054 TaxID=1220578 RepID=A0A0E9N1J4_9BACT|nr:hypothetical protein FPE01S_02_09930 [Flavihumibacter petaseus NBRC 106054]
MAAKRIIFTINNDPSTDQRMQRICGTLASNGYKVVLVGRTMTRLPLPELPYPAFRLNSWLRKGPLSYAEFNIRLFWWLLFRKTDIICAIDLDTILPVYINSKWKNIVRVYDAHEYFSELKEVVRRPAIQKIWQRIESFSLQRFPLGYTVSQSIAEAFENRYGVRYTVIRNLPFRNKNEVPVTQRKKRFLYQGAINEGRGIEQLLEAMLTVPAELDLYGSGNRLDACKALCRSLGLQHKVFFHEPVPPETLRKLTPYYWAGINLVEPEGLNQLYSLANKFFDYIQAGIPQVTMNFPEYQRVQQEQPVGILLGSTRSAEIARALNHLLEDTVVYEQLTENCRHASKTYCWENEEKHLLAVYQKISDK